MGTPLFGSTLSQLTAPTPWTGKSTGSALAGGCWSLALTSCLLGFPHFYPVDVSVSTQDPGDPQRPCRFQSVQWLQWTPVPALWPGGVSPGAPAADMGDGVPQPNPGSGPAHPPCLVRGVAPGPCQWGLLQEERAFWEAGRGPLFAGLFRSPGGRGSPSALWGGHKGQAICWFAECGLHLRQPTPTQDTELPPGPQLSGQHGQWHPPPAQRPKGVPKAWAGPSCECPEGRSWRGLPRKLQAVARTGGEVDLCCWLL